MVDRVLDIRFDGSTLGVMNMSSDGEELAIPDTKKRDTDDGRKNSRHAVQSILNG